MISDITNPLILDAGAPTLSAHEFLERRKARLINWRNDFYSWTGTRYEVRDKKEIKAEVYRFGEMAISPDNKPFRPTIKKVDEIVAAIQVKTLVPDRYPQNCDIRTGKVMEGVVIPCQNGMLDLSADSLIPYTDDWLILNSLPFSYDPTLPMPNQWLAFLASLWPDDDGSEIGAISTLQEMMGYIVSGDTSLQKLFVLIGPPRSGKGTISWIVNGLVGDDNYVGKQFAQFSQDFGLQGLIGKSVVVIPDARTYSRDLGTATERLLNISGEDMISVHRKYMTDWIGMLHTRIILLSNEMPRFHDTSGVIATRVVPIRMTESFLGKEDTDLKQKLAREFPAILNWALVGAKRLFARGQFVSTPTQTQMIEEIADNASPIRAFIRDRLIWVDPEAATLTKDHLYSAYSRWCDDNGHQRMASNMFSQRLREWLPSLAEGRHFGCPRHWVGLALRRDDDTCSSALNSEPITLSYAISQRPSPLVNQVFA